MALKALAPKTKRASAYKFHDVLVKGLDAAIESYSGLLTVDAPNNGNMFFWFFPAAENPETAPVVIWLQVGHAWIFLDSQEA